jgi:hypothetical protein
VDGVLFAVPGRIGDLADGLRALAARRRPAAGEDGRAGQRDGSE